MGLEESVKGGSKANERRGGEEWFERGRGGRRVKGKVTQGRTG